MRKILIIGNKKLTDRNINYKKLGNFINNNFDIIVRYNNCDNYSILQTNVHILFLNLNKVFINNYWYSQFRYVKDNKSLQTIFFSIEQPELYNDKNMQMIDIPKTVNKTIFINKNVFNDIYNKNILSKKNNFFIFIRTLPVIISYILNVFKNSEIYVYGFDIYNRSFDKYTKFGYLHQYSDLIEELYFISLLKEKKIKLLETTMNDNKLSFY